ncbi:N-myc-interactor-like isoform X2 [Megalops cyprinoides]|uniref:N-myc-interactor-like isoform X2 n=1 Tax=Megalops cyprinoides TaxID=118141 RepID=UPI00186448B0|nr:N-myc-interactor-like isoform X2 [Megalops cyprinoides]XP_036401801.1 N-myc-interactor-like isoform X2 [Megalops cyprinoides]
MASTGDALSRELHNGSLSLEEQKQFTEALEELKQWKTKVEKADQEKSRLLLEKLDSEETKRKAQKETLDLMELQKKRMDASQKMKEGLEDKILDLEKHNRALEDQLKEYEKILENKKAEYASLQKKFKINADIPVKKVVFTGVEKKESRENCQNTECMFTITQRPLIPLKGGQALITFEEEEVAGKILKQAKCPVTIENKRMDVKPSCVSLEPTVKFEVHLNVSKRKIQFSNAPPVLPEERMRDRLEASFSKPSQGGGEVEEVVYNKDTGTGQIVFLNTGVAENLALKKKYNVDASREVVISIYPYFEYQLKKFQTFCGVSKRTVLLSGIEDIQEEEDQQDLLEIHFQKPSSHGGEVENIKYLSRGKNAEAIFTEDTTEPET